MPKCGRVTHTHTHVCVCMYVCIKYHPQKQKMQVVTIKITKYFQFYYLNLQNMDFAITKYFYVISIYRSIELPVASQACMHIK